MSNTNKAVWCEEVVNGVRTQVDWGFVEEERRVENIHPWMRLAEALNGYPQDAAFPARKIADPQRRIEALCSMVLQTYKNYSVEKDIDKE